MSDKTSRFFTLSDEHQTDFFFPLHKTWWSRFYEYVWAGQFVASHDVSLDAASGICHPFKFFLADHGHETQAVDADWRILDKEAIKKDVEEVFGTESRNKLSDRYFQVIQYQKAKLEKMPYQDKKFDKIYCISVLEHLNDWFNKYHFLNRYFHRLNKWLPKGLYDSLREFKRVLKDDGLIVLTFDYPTINLEYFQKVVSELELNFADDVDFSLPEQALYSLDHHLYCFRAVLIKKT